MNSYEAIFHCASHCEIHCLGYQHMEADEAVHTRISIVQRTADNWSSTPSNVLRIWSDHQRIVVDVHCEWSLGLRPCLSPSLRLIPHNASETVRTANLIQSNTLSFTNITSVARFIIMFIIVKLGRVGLRICSLTFLCIIHGPVIYSLSFDSVAGL